MATFYFLVCKSVNIETKCWGMRLATLSQKASDCIALIFVDGRLTFHPCWQSSSGTGQSPCTSSPCCPPSHWPWWRGPGLRSVMRLVWCCSPGWAGSGRTRRNPLGRGRGVRFGLAIQVWRWWAGPGSGWVDSSDSETMTLLMEKLTTQGHLESKHKHQSRRCKHNLLAFFVSFPSKSLRLLILITERRSWHCARAALRSTMYQINKISIFNQRV